MNQTAVTVAATSNPTATQDAQTNKAIREVASTPSAQHIIPAEIVAGLYSHVDLMRAEFFGGQVPEVVLSFDVTDKRTLGHYHLKRNGLGVRWAINLNPVHFTRSLADVLATLLHELAHAWQFEHGTPSKPPHHNKEFQEKCEAFGVPTDAGGHDLGIRPGSPFEDYCRRHGVPLTPAAAGPQGAPGAGQPPPLLPVPPATPRGSKLRKWTCPCGVNARVAIADFQATCNKCGGRFARAV